MTFHTSRYKEKRPSNQTVPTQFIIISQAHTANTHSYVRKRVKHKFVKADQPTSCKQIELHAKLHFHFLTTRVLARRLTAVKLMPPYFSIIRRDYFLLLLSIVVYYCDN